jgi:hypothetical protein
MGRKRNEVRSLPECRSTIDYPEILQLTLARDMSLKTTGSDSSFMDLFLSFASPEGAVFESVVAFLLGFVLLSSDPAEFVVAKFRQNTYGLRVERGRNVVGA